MSEFIECLSDLTGGVMLSIGSWALLTIGGMFPAYMAGKSDWWCALWEPEPPNNGALSFFLSSFVFGGVMFLGVVACYVVYDLSRCLVCPECGL